MQSLKLGTIGIGPWDHDLVLSIAFNDCGKYHTTTTGMSADLSKECQSFVSALEHITKYLEETGFAGKLDRKNVKTSVSNPTITEQGQIKMTMPFYFRSSSWSSYCSANEHYDLTESWSSCLKKQRLASKKNDWGKSHTLSMDVNLKSGIEGGNTFNQLYVDLVGPLGSVHTLGKEFEVDELRVGLNYDKSTKELWHMEYIDMAYGNTWLENPWACEWKYDLTFG